MKNSTIRFDAVVVVLTLCVSGYLIYSRISYFRGNLKQKESYESKTEETLKSQKPPQTADVEKKYEAQTHFRNILFKYRNPSAKKVSIVGDFNDWVPQDMEKDPRGLWSVTLKIPPGYYAYNFIVDGRPQKDVNNPRITDTGRGFVSSYLEVKALDK